VYFSSFTCVRGKCAVNFHSKFLLLDEILPCSTTGKFEVAEKQINKYSCHSNHIVLAREHVKLGWFIKGFAHYLIILQ